MLLASQTGLLPWSCLGTNCARQLCLTARSDLLNTCLPDNGVAAVEHHICLRSARGGGCGGGGGVCACVCGVCGDTMSTLSCVSHVHARTSRRHSGCALVILCWGMSDVDVCRCHFGKARMLFKCFCWCWSQSFVRCSSARCTCGVFTKSRPTSRERYTRSLDPTPIGVDPPHAHGLSANLLDLDAKDSFAGVQSQSRAFPHALLP